MEGGVFRAEVPDPEMCQASSTLLWELCLFSVCCACTVSPPFTVCCACTVSPPFISVCCACTVSPPFIQTVTIGGEIHKLKKSTSLTL